MIEKKDPTAQQKQWEAVTKATGTASVQKQAEPATHLIQPKAISSAVKTYVGTKVLEARPMTRAAYNDYRGWQLPANENGADEGYLVEYRDGGASNDSRHAGYISWSPKDVFERTYREI